MADYKLPAPSIFRSLTTDQRLEIITHLFEESPALEQQIVDQFDTELSYSDFIEGTRKRLLALAVDARSSESKKRSLLEILAAHPRLGARKITSDHSVAEQRSLQGESEALASLNHEYEAKFPGLRYVVFVNGRSREMIMENMRARIARGDYELEKEEAANAMCDIATDRARKLGASV
ncbi:Oxo-4-hydroxy-4-carboxy-5-ureidoimidazoline decarboxylase [Kockiozyma suomiensis]|uniref:Oxo-4-hydroxy-4-carboxy-5-ureidoimidazoline decarboxylase n=1 Tax=Kockiozyma suomiensis TaxID=1337062 RepID=UPI003343574A